MKLKTLVEEHTPELVTVCNYQYDQDGRLRFIRTEKYRAELILLNMS